MVGDVEEDGAVALFGAAADQLEGLLVALQQRRQQLGDKGLAEHLGQRHLGEQRNEARNEGIGSCADSMISVSFMAGAAISTAASGLSYFAPSTMSAQ